jgi:hypothetical protein
MSSRQSFSSRIRRHIRNNVVGYVAVFLALSGTAVANHETILSSDIVDGEVKSQDIGQNAVKSGKIENGQVQTPDLGQAAVATDKLKDGAVTSRKVLNDTLSFVDIGPGAVLPSELANGAVNSAKVADNSLTGADINESALSVANLGCQSGKVLGFARVKTQGSNLPTSYTSSSQFVDFANNCSGGAVQVRRPFCCGIYYVRFVNNPAALALAVGNTDGQPDDSVPVDNTIAVGKITGGPDAGSFRVETRDVEGDVEGQHQDTNFTILLP